MRIHVSLLAFCVALAGCKSSVDSANIDTVVVSSNPTAAAVRVNGEAVGRTPTTIKLDRTKNYELQVGKGGFLTETSEPVVEIEVDLERAKQFGVKPGDVRRSAAALLAADWARPYTREEAAYPVASLKRAKYWSPVGRIDNVHGDRNLFCSCLPLSAYEA